MYDFTHQRPASVDAAVAALTGADDGKIMAGGMTLIPTLKQRLASPSDVVDLGAIAALKGIKEEGGAIVIKAMTTHHAVATSDLVKSKIPALAELAPNEAENLGCGDGHPRRERRREDVLGGALRRPPGAR